MTTLLDGQTSAPEAPDRRGRRFWAVVALVTVLVLGAIGAGIGWIVYANTYQPFGSGLIGIDGPVSGANSALGFSSDGYRDTAVVLTGGPGTEVTYAYTLANAGPRSIRIQGLDGQPFTPLVRIGWAPLFGSTSNFGPERAFPMALGSHDEVALLVTVRQPPCKAGNFSGGIGSIPLHWSALGVNHVYDDVLTEGTDPLPIRVCPSKAVLRRLDTFR